MDLSAKDQIKGADQGDDRQNSATSVEFPDQQKRTRSPRAELGVQRT